MRPGKLPNSLLKQMLKGLPRGDPRVLVGPGVGEDAAHISFGGVTLIAKADPVTFATDLIGWYAVNVNANDVAASGGTPRWFLATVLLPEGQDSAGAAAIFDQVREAADELGVEVIGGHTEVTIGLPRPIVCGAMLGEAPASKAIATSGARVGDSVILTRGIAIEGTSILAREMPERLMAGGVGQDVIDRSAGYLFDPGISVVAAARVAVESGGVTAMHDPTEGGLATALWEVAEACGHGLEVDASAVTLLPETEVVCGVLDIDPWGLIASGSLLITVTPEAESNLLKRLAAARCAPAVIGRVNGSRQGVILRDGSGISPLRTFERDEIARVFEAISAGEGP